MEALALVGLVATASALVRLLIALLRETDVRAALLRHRPVAVREAEPALRVAARPPLARPIRS